MWVPNSVAHNRYMQQSTKNSTANLNKFILADPLPRIGNFMAAGDFHLATRDFHVPSTGNLDPIVAEDFLVRYRKATSKTGGHHLGYF